MTTEENSPEPQKNNESINHITPHFAKGLAKSVEVDTTQASGPLDAIMKDRRAHAPVAPQIPTVKIGKHEIHADAQTFLMYLVATEFSKKKSIAKILKQIKFTFRDVNGVQLFPKK